MRVLVIQKEKVLPTRVSYSKAGRYQAILNDCGSRGLFTVVHNAFIATIRRFGNATGYVGRRLLASRSRIPPTHWTGEGLSQKIGHKRRFIDVSIAYIRRSIFVVVFLGDVKAWVIKSHGCLHNVHASAL